jgi:hypothetical protein
VARRLRRLRRLRLLTTGHHDCRSTGQDHCRRPGLNDQIKGVADKLAAAGYRALVPDLYRGQVALEANEAEHLMNNLDFADAAGQDVRGAVQHLKA